MFKKFLTNATFLWLLALIIIIEGLILSNLELAPISEIRQPAVLGVKTESDVEFLPEHLSSTVIDEIKNKIQQQIETAQNEDHRAATSQSLNKSTALTPPSESFDRQNNSTETVAVNNDGMPVLTEENSANAGKTIKKESTVSKTTEQLKMEEINNILNQPEPKINLKKYQPALETEIFNPVKELIKKNLEIFKALTE